MNKAHFQNYIISNFELPWGISGKKKNRNQYQFYFFTLSLYIHCTYIVHTLYIYCTYTVHILYIHCTYIVHNLYIHCSYFVHTLYINCTYTALCIQCTYTVNTLYYTVKYKEYTKGACMLMHGSIKKSIIIYKLFKTRVNVFSQKITYFETIFWPAAL